MKFIPCNCERPYEACYRCAVTHVIRSIVGQDTCSCDGAEGGLCLGCRAKLLPPYDEAFARIEPTSPRLSKAYAQSKGLISETKVNPSTGSVFVRWRQDIERAAVELRSEVDESPLAYSAAFCFVADLVRSGSVVPASLREWSYMAMMGEANKPRQKAKHRGSTNMRDKLVVKLLLEIELMGVKPTTSNHERALSGCHAVAQAFSYLDLPPRRYEGVRAIWLRREKLSGVSAPEEW